MRLILILALVSSGCAIKAHTVIPHVTMAFSLGCESLDLATTMYYVGQNKVYETNPFLKDVQHYPIRFGLRKFALAGVSNVALYMLEEKHPTLASVGFVTNGLVKCYIAARNDRIGRNQ